MIKKPSTLIYGVYDNSRGEKFRGLKNQWVTSSHPLNKKGI